MSTCVQCRYFKRQSKEYNLGMCVFRHKSMYREETCPVYVQRKGPELFMSTKGEE